MTIDLATLIRTRRKELGLTQEQLADRAYLSPKYISALECGHGLPSLDTFQYLLGALDMRMDFVEVDNER